jgi:dTDP-4-dehydrorhamnose reductase
MRILLLGKNGQVGWELTRTLTPFGELVAIDQPELDLTDFDRIRQVVRKIEPALIVNAAAYTAVDQAENEPVLAMAVNGIAPRVLAEEAARLGAGLLHFSTDYVFDGSQREPYNEEDPPNPINVYGETKLAGDMAIQEVGGAYLILRTSWVYGIRGKNFFLTIIRLAREQEELKVVNDQFGCPTWSAAIATAVAQLLTRLKDTGTGKIIDQMIDHAGLYHWAASGECSWYDFAVEILANDPRQEEHREPRILPIPSSEYPTLANRPMYSVLRSEKIVSDFKIETISWEMQLKGCWESFNLEQSEEPNDFEGDD